MFRNARQIYQKIRNLRIEECIGEGSYYGGMAGLCIGCVAGCNEAHKIINETPALTKSTPEHDVNVIQYIQNNAISNASFVIPVYTIRGGVAGSVVGTIALITFHPIIHGFALGMAGIVGISNIMARGAMSDKNNRGMKKDNKT